jgi:polysaccharide export outer membrane protein
MRYLLEVMGKYFFSVLVFSLLCALGICMAQDYAVGEEDILKITVYDHPDLTTTARVSGEGVIAFPLIGNLKVSGLTTSQISQKIVELLADGYIVDPQVSVFIEEYKSKKTTFLGQVVKPGIYALSGSTTFLELLSKAGGLTKDAGEKAVINRRSNIAGKKESVITIDLKRLVEDGDASLNITIMDGDYIYVPKAGVFYITGEVKKPDAYKFEDGETVFKAISAAGGFTENASTGRVKIIRKVDGKEKVIEKAGMNERVLPDDIIVVPESFF